MKTSEWNWPLIGIAAAILAAIGFLAACAGSDIGNVIKQDVPTFMAQATGTAPVQSLNDYVETRRLFTEKVNGTLVAGDREYEKGAQFADFVSFLFNFGMAQFGSVDENGQYRPGPLGALPGGAIAFTLLGSLAGLMKRKPGDNGIIVRQNEQIEALKIALERAAAERAAAVHEAENRGWVEAKADSAKA